VGGGGWGATVVRLDNQTYDGIKQKPEPGT
jgi:hypothetical protein